MTTLPLTAATLPQLLSAARAALPARAAPIAAAHWSFETLGGQRMYGWNPGALTCKTVPGPCADNPLVTSGLTFVSFATLSDGAAGYVRYLQGKSGGVAYQALLTGEVASFAQALQAVGYSGDLPASGYQSGIDAWLPKLQALPVVPPSPLRALGWGTAATWVAAGILGTFVGTWAAEGWDRTWPGWKSHPPRRRYA